MGKIWKVFASLKESKMCYNSKNWKPILSFGRVQMFRIPTVSSFDFKALLIAILFLLWSNFCSTPSIQHIGIQHIGDSTHWGFDTLGIWHIPTIQLFLLGPQLGLSIIFTCWCRRWTRSRCPDCSWSFFLHRQLPEYEEKANLKIGTSQLSRDFLQLATGWAQLTCLALLLINSATLE